MHTQYNMYPANYTVLSIMYFTMQGLVITQLYGMPPSVKYNTPTPLRSEEHRGTMQDICLMVYFTLIKQRQLLWLVK